MTVEVPQRFETDRPVPGDPITRAEELIIKEARRRHRRRVLFRVGVATLVIAGLGTGVVVLAGHRASRSATSPLLARPGRPTPRRLRTQRKRPPPRNLAPDPTTTSVGSPVLLGIHLGVAVPPRFTGDRGCAGGPSAQQPRVPVLVQSRDQLEPTRSATPADPGSDPLRARLGSNHEHRR